MRSAAPAKQTDTPLAARRWKIEGRVQGVGFRPFVFRLAQHYGLRGWVCNGQIGVEIVAEGPEASLRAFGHDLLSRAPPLARPDRIADEPIPPLHSPDFRIRDSVTLGAPRIHVPPDQSVCADCLAEMRDPSARRFQHAFINCTQCGPRYTIIRALPYDRSNTTLASFMLCADCASEYADPLDRRFHAQPLACPRCGPRLYWHSRECRITTSAAALAACVTALRRGQIVAVRGVGGYHLMCDAQDESAVDALRARKHRPAKPLALMVPLSGGDGLDVVRRLALPTGDEAMALLDPARPIVLVRRRHDAPIAPSVAPHVAELGLMLPYSPLHHLLMDELGRALVATSANLSGEPVLTEPHAVERNLSTVADAFLHHDRPIERPADDPVMRSLAGRVRPIRLGRGTAPLELALNRPLHRPTLALGAFLKTTVALGWGDRVIVSPHIGDMSAPRSRRVLHEVAAGLQALYGVRAESIACDAHPDFPTNRWARDCGLPVTAVLHHHAHASAVAGEFGVKEPMLCFTWDGIGYGEDGTLWGGEAFIGLPGRWQRAASWRPFGLPGGARVNQQPWRTALGLCWEAGRIWPGAPSNVDPLLRQAFDSGWKTPQTSAVGRLFDAAAALLGLVDTTTFEAQAPMLLEALARDGPSPAIQLPLRADTRGVLRADWAPLLDLLLDESLDTAQRATAFHATLAQTLVRQAQALHARYPFRQIGLSGGVFQNRWLTQAAHAALSDCGFEVLVPTLVPMNDAGISYGQVIEAAAQNS
jgi:hydrogenase maturation protein HypF